MDEVRRITTNLVKEHLKRIKVPHKNTKWWDKHMDRWIENDGPIYWENQLDKWDLAGGKELRESIELREELASLVDNIFADVDEREKASAKSHFRIYPHNLHLNPDYPENARNSN